MEQILAQLPLLLLASSRVAGVTTASPIFANRFIAAQMRVAFTILLAFLILPGVRAEPAALTGTGLLIACGLELLVGLLIGFLGQLLFSVVQMAGSMLDVDMGFAMAQILDPVSGRSEPILGSFFQSLALVLYFALDAHHWLLRALAGSYDAIAAGALSATIELPMHVLSLFGSLLGAAVQMVLPFMGVMLLSTAALAGLSRVVPQINIFAVGIGLKAVAGLAVLILMLPYFMSFLERLFTDGQMQLFQVLELLR